MKKRSYFNGFLVTDRVKNLKGDYSYYIIFNLI